MGLLLNLKNANMKKRGLSSQVKFSIMGDISMILLLLILGGRQ